MLRGAADSPTTRGSKSPDAERVRLDAMINPLLSVQMMHEHFVAKDVPTQARDFAIGALLRFRQRLVAWLLVGNNHSMVWIVSFDTLIPQVYPFDHLLWQTCHHLTALEQGIVMNSPTRN